MEQFRFQDDELWCERLTLRAIAEQFGTPAYVYSRQSVIDHSQWIEQALKGIDHLSCYAVKANANREILRVLSEQRIGADAGSLGEMLLALESGFPAERVTFSGVGKSDEEIAFALTHGILAINAESEEELLVINEIAQQRHRIANVLLRVNFDIQSDTHPYVTTGRKHNKFGVGSDRAVDIFRRASSLNGIKLMGIHSHIGSQIINSETFIAAANAVVDLISRLRCDGMEISQLNFGGGFGVQYHDYVSHPDLPREKANPEADLATVKLLGSIVPILQRAECKIFIQPGRSIIAHAGILLTKVLYRKAGEGRTFVIVDAGMNDLLRPSLYNSYHQIVPLQLHNRPHEVVDVVGPLCESGDFFAHERALPRVERNEYLALLCTGAYGYVLSSNYNGRPRPVEIMVDGDQARIIRNRESLDTL